MGAYGIPGEDPAEYARMATMIPLLSHLKPPNLVHLQIECFSPYFQHPESHGLSLRGPVQCYSFLYDLAPEELTDIAYNFEFQYIDGRNPDSYIGEVRTAVEDWQVAFNAGSSLTYARGPGFLRIIDSRANQTPRAYTLAQVEAEVYLTCDDGATIERIWSHLRGVEMELSRRDIQDLLKDFISARLLIRDGDQ